MKIKYYKDLNHNYLIIKTQIQEGIQDYQHRMITGNNIKKLLSCKIRYVDEECHFYYEISSKQSLRNVFDKREMRFEQIYHLFAGMEEVQAEMEKYLLDDRCLLLCPDYIFTEPETEEYFFVYYPYNKQEVIEKETDKETDKEGRDNVTDMSLSEFLIDKVDQDDMDAVDVVYRIYELVQEDKFIISQIIKIFESHAEKELYCNKESHYYMEPHYNKESHCGTGPHCDKESSGNAGSNATHVCEQEYSYDYGNDFEEYDISENDGGKSGIQSRSISAVGVLSFLCMAAAAAIFSIGYFYTLSMEEKIISIAGIIILIILSAFFLVYFLLNYKKQKFTAKAKNRSHNLENELGEEKRESKTQNNMQEAKHTGLFSPEMQYMEYANTYPSQTERMRNKGNPREYEEAEDYGNTVFLENSIAKMENKLYGTNKGNKYHIDLSSLPCIVGKLAGSVDVVIKDKTISRIHAKILRQEEEIYVTDLNSTNGTFKNGLRIEPNEMVLIEPGDELRFGEMTFSYR